MPTKITVIYDQPQDPDAFEAGYSDQLALAAKMPGIERLESSKVWPKEDGTPTPAYRLLDLYFTKTAADTWEVAVYDQSTAAPTTSFPYSAGPLATQTLTFDPTTGKLDGASATNISIPVPNGSAASSPSRSRSTKGTR